jgi:arylsulfatase A-like enzyme
VEPSPTGWATAWFGKWHLSPNYAIPRYGFAHVFQPPRGNDGRQGDPEVAARAAAWIRERPAGQPWRAVVSILNPQVRNLAAAGEHAARKAELRRRLDAWIASTRQEPAG